MEQLEQLIEEGNLNAIRSLLTDGLDPNAKVGIYNSTLECAFDCRQYEVAKLFIEHGAEINDRNNPAIVDAAHGDRALFEYLIQKGSDINAVNRVGHSALSRALAFDNDSGAIALVELGIDIQRLGGKALRDAAWNGNERMVQYLIERGADIHYCEPDQVFVAGDTSLLAATSGNHLKIVEYLLEHGADISYCNKLGDRAYHIAKSNQFTQLADLLKSREPAEYHDYNRKMAELTAAGLPSPILDTLGKENRKLEFKGKNCEYLIFRSLYDIKQFSFKDYEVYDLLLELDNYGADGVITWCPSKQLFISIDLEHDTVTLLNDLTWDAFVQDPGTFLDRILEGDYEPEELEIEDEN
ncbi:ankyrin repeat domain-containing protein [Cohnella sp.]|uniref:ankyrin repeat domain-containing protein n=1 Tax=Cohnella sp. TaxID=1883426 RepID=UPI0035638E7C